MSRTLFTLGSLLLLAGLSGCSALGTSHSGITAITPTSYVSKHPDSRMVNAYFETVRGQSPDHSVDIARGW